MSAIGSYTSSLSDSTLAVMHITDLLYEYKIEPHDKDLSFHTFSVQYKMSKDSVTLFDDGASFTIPFSASTSIHEFLKNLETFATTLKQHEITIHRSLVAAGAIFKCSAAKRNLYMYKGTSFTVNYTLNGPQVFNVVGEASALITDLLKFNPTPLQNKPVLRVVC